MGEGTRQAPGYAFATQSGASMGLKDMIRPAEKDAELVKAGLVERHRGSGTVVSRRVRQTLGRVGLLLPTLFSSPFTTAFASVCQEDGWTSRPVASDANVGLDAKIVTHPVPYLVYNRTRALLVAGNPTDSDVTLEVTLPREKLGRPATMRRPSGASRRGRSSTDSRSTAPATVSSSMR